MADRRLIVVDPGHFHAALVQKEMCPALSPRVHVLAPVGPDLVDYLARIARFNTRAEAPTRWALDIRADADFLDRLRREPAGGIAIFSGRNHTKIERIIMALDAGLHVLADKPVIIRREDLPRLEAALELAEAQGLVFADMMTGRHDTLARLVQALRADPEVFGEPVAGTSDEPGVALSGVHHLLKTVAGVPNPRPPWYFDVAQQGEGLADTAVHLVDRTHQTLFPGEALDASRDIELLAATRWPTQVRLDQFRHLTGEARWPDYLAPFVRGDMLDYFCNGRVDYRVRGIHVRIAARWEWQAQHGDDTSEAVYRGSRCRLELRQGAAEDYRQELYVIPEAEIATALARRIAALERDFPGISFDRREREWRAIVPDAIRVGHDTGFAEFTRRFLADVDDPGGVPAWHGPNLLAKFGVTTGAVALSHR